MEHEQQFAVADESALRKQYADVARSWRAEIARARSSSMILICTGMGSGDTADWLDLRVLLLPLAERTVDGVHGLSKSVQRVYQEYTSAKWRRRHYAHTGKDQNEQNTI